MLDGLAHYDFNTLICVKLSSQQHQDEGLEKWSHLKDTFVQGQDTLASYSSLLTPALAPNSRDSVLVLVLQTQWTQRRYS